MYDSAAGSDCESDRSLLKQIYDDFVQPGNRVRVLASNYVNNDQFIQCHVF